MASKTRRPVAMITPPRLKARSAYTAGDKQSLLDNFDLEVADKTRNFRDSLSARLKSFQVRQETELLRIPRELRNMTLGEFEGKWGGSWAGTLMRLKRDEMEEEEERREREEEERMEKGKRKRGTANTLDTSPVRVNKNPRRDAEASTSTSKQLLRPSTAANKRKPPTQARQKPTPATSTSKPPSGLPQDHIFNPLLPPTPSFPRQARRNESLISLNGSPIAAPPPSSLNSPCPSDDESDLPDPEALEREILDKSITSAESLSKPSRKTKRAPSLMFRQSIAPRSVMVKADDVVLATIPLSDGRTLSFNPLDLSPGRMDGEMDEGGLSEPEKEQVKAKVREEVVKTLTEQMARWKVA